MFKCLYWNLLSESQRILKHTEVIFDQRDFSFVLILKFYLRYNFKESEKIKANSLKIWNCSMFSNSQNISPFFLIGY